MAMTFRSRASALRRLYRAPDRARSPGHCAGRRTAPKAPDAGGSDDPATLQSEPRSNPARTPAPAADDGDITITGSRIRRPNLEFDRSDHLDRRRGILRDRPASRSATCSTSFRRCAAPSASPTRAASSAPPASTCSTFAASAPSAPWCWSNGRRHVARRRSQQRRLARREHDPDRSDRARRRRHRRQFGHLRLGRHRGRRQLRPEAEIMTASSFAARAASANMATPATILSAPSRARISPTAAATSRSTSNMPARTSSTPPADRTFASNSPASSPSTPTRRRDERQRRHPRPPVLQGHPQRDLQRWRHLPRLPHQSGGGFITSYHLQSRPAR